MAGESTPEALPEADLNDLLRRVDWRFLLRGTEAPRIADLSGRRASQAIQLIGGDEPAAGAADVAAIGFPTRLALGAALDAVRPGGEVVCLWRTPRPAGAQLAARRLRRAGLEDVRILWPGPAPGRAPQFWLPLGSTAAARHLLAGRPTRSPAGAALRLLWRAAARGGLLAPLCAIGRLPAGGEPAEADGIGSYLPRSAAPLLLTGGARSINKVVALPFADEATETAAVVKFARVAAADAALDREAAALRSIEEKHPEVPGIPRLLARERRAGRRALAESAVHGRPLIEELTPATFGELARSVTGWLAALAGAGEPQPASEWWDRLVGEPLAAFERDFGAAAGADTVGRARQRLEGLGDLPQVCEHRDCSPWNVVLTGAGTPGLLDWESAEPRGLPGLDLAYFLANAAFVLDGALDSGRTRESYVRLLDPTSPYGAEAARCEREYRNRLELSAETFSRLRLLAWIVHSRSDYRHLEMETSGPPGAETLRGTMFLGLVEAELRSTEAA